VAVLLFITQVLSIHVGDGTILLHQYQAVSIYEAATLVQGGSYAVSALGYNNAPTHEFEVINIKKGSTTVAWTFTGPDFELAGSHIHSLFAAMEFTFGETGGNVTVNVFSTSTSNFMWGKTFVGMYAPEVGGVLISRNEKILAVLVNKLINQKDFHMEVYWYDSLTGENLGGWVGPEGTWAINAQISNDGKYLGFISYTTVYVLDISVPHSVPKVLMDHNFQFSTDCFCMSSDGKSVFYAFQFGYLWQYNPAQKNFTQSWVVNGNGVIAGYCAMSNNNLALGWFTLQYNQNTYQYYSLSSNTPTWVHVNKIESGPGQDLPVNMAITDDGKYFVVASWGNEAASNPQLIVFNSTSSTPYYSITSPGSMFVCDIAYDNALGGVVVLGAGKHVHANVFGDGGDLYVALIPTK